MNKIPLDSPLDLGTVDIIQSEPQFKKKNGLIYKGVLSNITKLENNDGAYLSTYGNVIETTHNEIKSENYEVNLGNTNLVTEKGRITLSDTILHARYVQNKVYVIQSSESGVSDFVFTVYNADTKETITNRYTALTENDEQVNAYILPNNRFCTKGGRIIQIWDIKDDGTAEVIRDTRNSSYFLMPTSGSAFYCGKHGDYYFFGTDDTDLRKRSCVRKYLVDGSESSWDYTDIDLGAEIIGFGCVSEHGLVTGEPVYVESMFTPNWSHDDEGPRNPEPYPENGYIDLMSYSEDSTYYRFDYAKSMNCNIDNGITLLEPYFIRSTLDNGVIQIQPLDPTKSGKVVTAWDSSGYQQAEASISSSFASENANIGVNPEAEQTTESIARNQYLYHSLLSAYNDTSHAQRPFALTVAMVLGFDLSNDDVRTYILPAMTRVASTVHTFNTSTRISFCDYDSPSGSLDKNILDGQQVFPHLRFFENDTTKKGSNWDYGRGWSRAIVDSILVYNGGGNYGQAVMEEPLRLYELDTSGIQYHTIDVLNKTVSNSYLSSSSQGFPRTTTQQADSSKTFDTEATWAKLYGNNSKPMSYNSMNSNIFDTRVRLHRITDTQKSSSGTYYYSHNFTGLFENSILLATPFRCYEGSGAENHIISVPIYNGLKTSICFDETLLTTPTDMGENYSVTYETNGYDIHVATWASGVVSYANCGIDVETTEKITIQKLSDFIFRTNILGDKNLLIEDRNGNLNLQNGFLGYSMDTVFNCEIDFDLKMPMDGQSYVSNDIYYYGSGVNSGIKEEMSSTSFLLPAITIPCYCHPDDTSIYTKEIIYNRKGLLRARLIYYNIHLVPENIMVQEFWTHTAATTDVLYKDSRLVLNGSVVDTFEEEYKDTSWIPSSDITIYPVGILSKTYGENYISATVDTGNNYVARFYNKDNKTFVVFNQNDQVYYGSEIFTIQSGNYYFDSQGIYYLGSQTDYSQNIFTAYALGMTFLANSSSEAYFYSKWDKSIYVFTASNTVQKAFSLADMPYIVDAVYSSNEQCLYILFEDGSLYIKSQGDDAIIEGTDGIMLQTNENGGFVIKENGFAIYNPYLYSDKVKMICETEWLGDEGAVQKTSFVDVVLYSDEPVETTFDLTVKMIQNGVVVDDTKTFTVEKGEWKNQFARVRYVPSKTNLVGNAVKIRIASESISIFSLLVEMNPVSTAPQAPRALRG